ncbi:MAG: bifunctional diaminohydroxyphosphoribosylaminopyrimidine deaminase/5-amino-6-(5-phosphoribosylamino)uracil reductase RibD [Bacteroidota bacterium]
MNANLTEIEQAYLTRALRLAQLGGIEVLPNPQVGAILVANGRIIGEGFHQKAGHPHAEVNAVREVRDADRDLLTQATMFVSLEPCSHHGKTPPCADMIVRERIPKVVIGCLDPNPRVAGRGVHRLISHGVEVKVAPDPRPFWAMNPSFNVNHLEQRPFVTLKWASSRDGFIAASSGGVLEQVAISSPEARVGVHRLRARHQAIMVGRRTAAIDDPSLSTRHYPGASPLRIVFDPELSLPTDLRIFQDGAPTLVLNRLRHAQEGTVLFYRPQQWTNLNLLFRELYQQLEICNILVEGGSHLLQQCLDQQVFDEVVRLEGPVLLSAGLAEPRLPSGFQFDEEAWLGRTRWSALNWRMEQMRDYTAQA